MTFENETDRMLDNKWTFPICIVSMGILACVAYSHLLYHPFSTDDFEHIADVEAILEEPTRLFSPEYHYHGRPLVDIVFLIGYVLWGKNPGAYHALTIAFHFLVSLRLMQTFRLFGASTLVSMLAGAFFLLYAANFETMQWIAAAAYILALIFALEVLRLYKNVPLSRPQMLLAALYILLGILAQPASVFVLGVCVYIAYTRTESLSETIFSTIPSVLAGFIGVGCVYVFYASSPQVEQWSISTDISFYFQHLGHLILWAFYFPMHLTIGQEGVVIPTTSALIVGISFALILFFLIFFRKTPVSIWSLWMLAALVPFFTKPALYSRYFYFASAGSAFVLAYFFIFLWTAALKKISRPIAYTTGIVILAVLISSSIFTHKRAEAIALYFAGRAHIFRKFDKDGIELLTRALQKNARGIPIDAYDRLVLNSFSEGKNPTPILREGLKHYPNHPQHTPKLNLLLGLSMYLDDTQITEGKALVQKIYESSPNKASLHALVGTCLRNLARYYSKNKDYEKAVSLWREALVFQPNNQTARFSLIPLLFELNRTNEAIQATHEAIDMYPDNKDIAFHLFVILFNKEQYADAEKVYRHYFTLNPQAENADFYLGTLALVQGRYEEAILSLQRATKDDPDNPDAHLYLAQALEIVGRTQEAIRAYRRVLALDPHNKVANDRLKANETRP